jgi:hypothetical protein
MDKDNPKNYIYKKSHNDSKITLKDEIIYLGFPSHSYTTATGSIYIL